MVKDYIVDRKNDANSNKISQKDENSIMDTCTYDVATPDCEGISLMANAITEAILVQCVILVRMRICC